MTDYIYKLLSKIYPVYRQGSMSDMDEYPVSFFTYWNNGSTLDSFYDNKEKLIIWSYDINFYTKEIENIDNILNKVVDILKKENRIVIEEYIHDLVSDDNNYIGKGLTINILEREDK